MKRFDVIEIRILKCGDVFYFPDDAKKTVWEVSSPETYAPVKDKIVINRKYSTGFKHVAPNTTIVFLRGN
jgi:hypothetical protein